MTLPDVFFVLDFDRCLGNTVKLNDVLETVVEREAHISRERLQKARFEAEKQGKAFDTARYVREQLAAVGDTNGWQRLQRLFIKEARTQDMLEPYAHELLRILDSRSLPYGILTFGSEAWQLAKIEASNLLHVPHLVTHIETKSELLAGWRKNNGFMIPPVLTSNFRPLAVRSITFLDDKAVSFYGMPTGVRGVHITGVGTPVVSQGGVIPPGVTSVKGLYGAIELLFPGELTVRY